MTGWDSAEAALLLTGRLAAAGVCLTSVELMVHARTAFQRGDTDSYPRAYVIHENRDVLHFVVFLRLTGALALLAQSGGFWACASAFLVLATSLWLFLRHSPGQTGAEGMYVLVFGGLAAAWSGDSAVRREVAPWFIALQLCLCYGTAG